MSIGTAKERGREEISVRLASFHFLYCPLIFRAGPQRLIRILSLVASLYNTANGHGPVHLYLKW
jgi:hypothetical protein